MDVGKIVSFKGKKYIAVRNYTESGNILGCRDCAFFDDAANHAACGSIGDCVGVIFKPCDEIQPAVEPPKYTVADFVEAFSAVVHAMSSNQIARVSDYLEKKHNTDYQLYLELKKRFEK